MRTSPALLLAAAALAAAASSFQPPVALTLSRQSLPVVSVAVADFNRDGLADVATANVGVPPLAGSQVSTIGILSGTRGGLPGNLNEIPVEGNVTEILAADVTGDANPDLLFLTITTSGTRLCTLPGTGLGFFLTPVCSPVTGSPAKIAVADYDRDSRPDVFLLRPLDATILVMRNNSGGFFVPGPSATVPTPAAFALADWNADGTPDAAVLSRTGQINLLLSGPSGLFQSTQSRPVSPSSSDILAIDLNRDNRPDLVLTDPQQSTLAYALGRNDYSAYLGAVVTQPFLARGLTLRAADMNGDAVPELLSATAAGMLVISSNADGTLNIPDPPGAPPTGIGAFAPGDFDGDNRVDLAVHAMSPNGATVFLLLSQPTATLTSLEATPLTSVYGARIQAVVRIRMAAPGPVAVPLAGASVQLYDGATLLQTVTAAPVAGGAGELANARVELALPVGARDLTARFLGNAAYTASTSGALRINVAPSPSTISLVAGSNDVSYTQGLRINASVTGALVLPSEGVVRLLVNGNVVSQGLVNNGISQLAIPPRMSLGRIRVKAVFEASNFVASETGESVFNVTGGDVTAASAASYRSTVAPDSLAVLAVPGLVRAAGASAAEVPWPLTLGGVQAELRDAAGGSRQRVGLIYAGTGQVNVHLPAGVPPGPRRIVVNIDGVDAAAGEIQIAASAPGLFTADSSGSGAPAAYAALYRAGGAVEDQPVFSCAGGRCFPAPLSLGETGDSLVITLFGTGFRNATVTATVDGFPAEVLFAGAQPGIPGLDQANVRIPREAAGRGEVAIVLFADGAPANAGRIVIR